VPFTLAHPAAALLFKRTRLPVAAMVAGAMSPDVPVFFDAYGRPYDFTHSALGVLTIDLVMGALAVACWFGFLRDPVVDVLPTAVRERLQTRARYTREQWLLVAPAVVAGSTTHVVWDLFTHHDRWGVRHIGWLHERHGQLIGYHWTQYVSSVLGLTVCALWAALALRSRHREPHPVVVPALGARAFVAIGVIVAVSGITAGLNAPEPGMRMLVSQTAVVGTMVAAFAVVVLAAVWNVLARRTR
jgi:hypothetical protein